jgi:hypothetical protein
MGVLVHIMVYMQSLVKAYVPHLSFLHELL